MKASTKSSRFVRCLAIAGAVTAFAVPAGANAMPIGPHNPPPMNYVSDQGSDSGAGMQQFGPGEITGGGAPLAHNTAKDVWASSLVSNSSAKPLPFNTDIPAVVRASKAGAYVQTPSSETTFKTDIPAVVRASNAGAYVQTPSTTIHEVKTVVSDDNSHTLAIALAGSALGIALCCAGYATMRLSRLQRRLGVSH
jgi:hypothetical protein